MSFTLRQIEYFVAAAEAGSITEAALNIPVAQSSVSTAIAQLEAALGVQLLIRHHAQGITPTAEGRLFAERARLLLREADELERFASELTSELSGTLNLGCLVTLAPLIAPRLGKGFREQHDGVALEMVEAGQDELMEGLRSGRLSVALTYDLELSDGIAFSPLATIFCNVMRILPTIWIYGYHGKEVGEVFHTYSGWLMLPISFLMLLGFIKVLRWAMIPVMRYTLAS